MINESCMESFEKFWEKEETQKLFSKGTKFESVKDVVKIGFENGLKENKETENFEDSWKLDNVMKKLDNVIKLLTTTETKTIKEPKKEYRKCARCGEVVANQNKTTKYCSRECYFEDKKEKNTKKEDEEMEGDIENEEMEEESKEEIDETTENESEEEEKDTQTNQ